MEQRRTITYSALILEEKHDSSGMARLRKKPATAIVSKPFVYMEIRIDMCAKGGGSTGMSNPGILCRLEQVNKSYPMGEGQVHALKDFSFDIYAGEIIAILGPSGSGKTTLLNLLGAMDRPDTGRILFREREISAANEREMTAYRRHDIGFVFQSFNLIPDLTAMENIELAAELASAPLSPRDLLAEIGMTDRCDHFPSQLSGGEQQRVAIARAIVKRPDMLLCDEPTGALDDASARQTLALLQEVAHSKGSTVVIVTHNSAIGAMANRVLRLRSGRLVEVTQNSSPIPAGEVIW
jgi:putative ABC transport system ATP-binding protein